MGTFIIHQPEQEHIELLLTTHQWDPVGKMVRLALWAGLTRSEILSLTWGQISSQGLLLPKRTVPLDGVFYAYLTQCPGEKSGHVVLSPRTHQPLTSQGAGHSLRQAFAQVGESELRLSDLRSMYIISLLQRHTPAQVCRWSGLSLLTLKADFGAYVPVDAEKEPQEKSFSRSAVETIVQHDPKCAASRAIYLAWKEGMAVKTMATLTWEDLGHEQKQLLGWAGETGLVLVGPRGGRGLTEQRISRIAGQTLVSGGVDHVTLQDLILDYHQQQNGEEEILDYVTQHHGVSTAQLSQHLNLDKTTVFHQLKRLCGQGRMVQVGGLYYLPSQVVHPEQQQEVMKELLLEYGAVMRKDVADLLKITPNQCSVLLKKWVNQGFLIQKGQTYYLA